MKKIFVISGYLLLFGFCCGVFLFCLLCTIYILPLPTIWPEDYIFKYIILAILIGGLLLSGRGIFRSFKAYKKKMLLISKPKVYLFGIIAMFLFSICLTLFLLLKPIWIVDEGNNALEFKKITIIFDPGCWESPCGGRSRTVYSGYTLWGGLVFIPFDDLYYIVQRGCASEDQPEYSFKIDGYELPRDLYCKQPKTDIVQMYKTSDESKLTQ